MRGGETEKNNSVIFQKSKNEKFEILMMGFFKNYFEVCLSNRRFVSAFFSFRLPSSALSVQVVSLSHSLGEQTLGSLRLFFSCKYI